MGKITIEDIEEKGLLLYRYKRGSVAQGTFIEGKSDIDTCTIYLAPPEQLLGLGFDYQDDLTEDKHDDVVWEFNKFMKLLLKSNPTVLEALFVDDEFVEYEHPIFTELKKHRDEFVTKQCFPTFGGYATSQIVKCRSLNKKLLCNEEKHIERRSALSFCYTFNKQGSVRVEDWLASRGLLQECCGLNKIPNMRDTYGVFYDWGQHWEKVGYTYDQAMKVYNTVNINEFKDGRYLWTLFPDGIVDDTVIRQPLGYRGIFKNDESTEVRLSSINDKYDKPICYMVFNKDGFKTNCKEYNELVEWREKRNPVRYASNKDKNYDAKNVSHSFRLMAMCTEIANGIGCRINRNKIDRDFLLDVKMHKYNYEEVMEMLAEKKKEMDYAIANSIIPDHINVDLVNNFVVKVRKQQLGLLEENKNNK